MRYLRDCFWWYLGIVAWPIAMAMLERGHRHRFFYWLLGVGGMQAFSEGWQDFRLCVRLNQKRTAKPTRRQWA